MRKLFLLECIIVALAVFTGGCASNSDYCCTSNDQCRTVDGKATYCTMDACGKCQEVDQLLTLSAVKWQDAQVGQPYKVELKASGGIPPYDWDNALAKLNDNDNKLGWLVLVKDDSDNTIAWLQNDTSSGTPQFPSTATTANDALTITVTVKDNTRHNTDTKKVDNSIAVFSSEIKITCSGGCLDQNGQCQLPASQNDKMCGTTAGDCIPCANNQSCVGGVCKYLVGSTGPGGGIVFYDNPNYTTDGWQYLEAALQDQSISAAWGCSDTPIPGSYDQKIGTGYTNTQAIINANCSDSTDAANLCYGVDLNKNEHTDWFLPSWEELKKLYNEKTIVGNLTYDYWSSSSYSTGVPRAFGVWFDNGSAGGYDKTDTIHVRCVRSGP